MSGLFGERVAALRVGRGLSVSHLARKVDVSESAIRQIENGKTKSASLLVGLRLARLFEVSPWYLATGFEAPADGARATPAAALGAVERLALELHALDRRVSRLENGRGEPGPRARRS